MTENAKKRALPWKLRAAVTALLLASGGAFPASAGQPAPAPDRLSVPGLDLRLPAGWHQVHTEAGGRTGVASFPALADGAEGEVILQAADPAGRGSLFVVRVPGRVSVGDDVEDAVSVAAPEALRRLWGVDVRVVWAAVEQLGSRPAVVVEGACTHDGLRYALLLALVPAGRVHYFVTYTVPADDDAPLDRVRRSLASLRPAVEAAGPDLPPGAVGAGVGALVGAVWAVVVRRRRRRRQYPKDGEGPAEGS